jgi:sulfite exporter TauE/SafE
MSFTFKKRIASSTLATRVIILVIAGLSAMLLIGIATNALAASDRQSLTLFICWLLVAVIAISGFIGTLLLVLVED